MKIQPSTAVPTLIAASGTASQALVGGARLHFNLLISDVTIKFGEEKSQGKVVL